MKNRILKSFNDFKINETIENTDGTVVVNLSLTIQPEFVAYVTNKIAAKGLDVSVETVLNDYFMYQSGYNNDSTYGEEFDEWFNDNNGQYAPDGIASSLEAGESFTYNFKFKKDGQEMTDTITITVEDPENYMDEEDVENDAEAQLKAKHGDDITDIEFTA